MPAEPIRIAAGNPGPMTGAGNNTWLIDGAEPTLIDAGVGLPSHLDAIRGALGGRPLARVLVTHGHPDHAAGVPALRDAWPGIDVCKLPLPDDTGVRPLADGDRVGAGDGDVVAVFTPGHAADHLCFWDAGRQWLYGGDLVLSSTTVMIPAGRGGSLRQYLESLERVRRLAPVRIYPGHGDVIDRPADVIASYIQHRQLRERQIVAALDRGVTDVDGLVDCMYPGLSDGLRRAARMTVEAHLEKLREEGRRD